MELTIKQRIEELKKIQDDLTTSDLQGIAQAIGLDSGIDEEDILSYVYGKIDINEIGGLK